MTVNTPFDVKRYRWCLFAGAAAALAVFAVARFEEARLKAEYVHSSRAEFAAAAQAAEGKFADIYQNLRTLSYLPGVRKIERHAGNVTGDVRETFQQIYNNLASKIDVSEVYIVPADLDPGRMDPVTGKLEEPILMFDELIVNGGKGSATGGEAKGEPEIESFEYRQYVEQFEWFRAHAATNSSFAELQVPMISGPEVITCDNRYFNQSKRDADRMGVSFAVPFYGEDGALKGSIVAVILSSTLRGFAASSDVKLVNTGYGYTAGNGGAAISVWAQRAEADPGLIFSDAAMLKTADINSPWRLWAGKPDSRFLESAALKKQRGLEWAAYGASLMFALGLMFITRLSTRNTELVGEVATERFVTLGKLTATVSHELRNPLGAIRNLLFMIGEVAEDNAEIKGFAKRAEHNVVRCDNIISDLLEYTRANPVQPKPADAKEWLRSVLADQRAPANVTIKADLAGAPVMANIDRERLRRAIINLVENAAQAITGVGKPGEVRVGCRGADENVVITIEDTGPGIDPENLPKIFEALFTTKNFGAGLGLPITRKLVEQHGGTIAVASEKGVGTVFTIRLPAAKIDEQKRAA